MTVGQTPPGWYDDGHGQLRYFDGTAWTENTQPLPPPAPPTPPPPPPPAAPETPSASAPAAPPAAAGTAPGAPGGPAAPVAAGAAAGAAGAAAAGPAAAPAAGAPAAQQVAPAEESKPIYRKPWFLVLIGLVVLALIAGAIALASGGDDEPGTSGTGTTPTSPAAPTGQSFVGGEPSAVAAAAGCTPGTPAPTQTIAPTQGAAPKGSTTCTLNGTEFTVVTWNTAADQANPQSLANAFTPPIAAGTKYFASGNGWTAFDAAYTQTGAQSFATAAGGTVQSVVVVTEGTAATPAVPATPAA